MTECRECGNDLRECSHVSNWKCLSCDGFMTHCACSELHNCSTCGITFSHEFLCYYSNSQDEELKKYVRENAKHCAFRVHLDREDENYINEPSKTEKTEEPKADAKAKT